MYPYLVKNYKNRKLKSQPHPRTNNFHFFKRSRIFEVSKYLSDWSQFKPEKIFLTTQSPKKIRRVLMLRFSKRSTKTFFDTTANIFFADVWKHPKVDHLDSSSKNNINSSNSNHISESYSNKVNSKDINKNYNNSKSYNKLATKVTKSK